MSHESGVLSMTRSGVRLIPDDVAPSTAELDHLLRSYLDAHVTVELVEYGGEGVNLDVGETKEFDLRVTNTGPLHLSDVTVEVESMHGLLSDRFWIGSDRTYWDAEREACVVAWAEPWVPTLTFPIGRLEPGETCGGNPPWTCSCWGAEWARMFVYRAEEPTGGADNDRDVEVLVAARVIGGRFVMDGVTDHPDGPRGTYASFVQRS